MRHKDFLRAIGCTLVMGLLAVSSANAETMYDFVDSGFNTSASGIQDPSPLAIGELNGQGGTDTGPGWKTTWLKYRPDVFVAGTATVQTATKTEGDQAVKFVGAAGTANTSAYGRGFTTQSDGTILCEFDFRVGASSANWLFYLSDFGREDLVYDANDYVGAAAQVSIVGLTIKSYSNGTLYTGKWSALTLNTWYKLNLRLDMDAKTYKVGLNGDYDIARSFAPSPTAPVVSRINSFISSTNKTLGYLDKFTMTTSIPEPSTFVLLCLAVVGAMVGRCRGRRML